MFRTLDSHAAVNRRTAPNDRLVRRFEGATRDGMTAGPRTRPGRTVKARQQISCDKETTICRGYDAVLRDRNPRNTSARCEYRAMDYPGADSIHRVRTLEDFRDR